MRQSFFQTQSMFFLLATLFTCPIYAGICISKNNKTDYSVSKDRRIVRPYKPLPVAQCSSPHITQRFGENPVGRSKNKSGQNNANQPARD